MKQNLLFVISKISKVVFFEWLADSLNSDLYRLTFVIMNDMPTDIEEVLRKKKEIFYHVHYKNKLDMPMAIRRLVQIIRKEKITVLHAHLLDATLAGMVAGRLTGVKKIIFTRHHSNYHQVYHRKGIMYDKFCNWLATDIVAITDMVRKHLLAEGAAPDKIHLIHHGFKLEEYSICSTERIVAFRNNYRLGENRIIVGVVSRYTLWKGIQFIIPAFKIFLIEHPTAILILANAIGNDQAYLKSLISQIPTDNVREIVYERDMAALYHSLDIYIHAPIDPECEAFGQTYIEALAAGTPSVFTLSGIANDFIVEDIHALVVPFKDSEAILEAMNKLCDNKALREKLSVNGQKEVKEKFSLQTMVTQLENLYLEK